METNYTQLPHKQPWLRSVILACLLTLFSLITYGYDQVNSDDYAVYSIPALKKVFPENFIYDSYVQSIDDLHIGFTTLLTFLLRYNIEIIGLFFLFIVSKFLIYLAFVRLANVIIPEYILWFTWPVFLSQFIDYGIASSYIVTVLSALPRLMAWGPFLLALNQLLSKKFFSATLLLALASSLHIHFISFSLIILFLALYFNKTKGGAIKIHYRYLVIFLVLILPILFHSIQFSNNFTLDKDLLYELYINTFGRLNYLFSQYITLFGPTFLIICTPLFFYKKVKLDDYRKKLWTSVIITISAGILVTSFFFEVIFVPKIAFHWYAGFGSFISFTSFLIFIYLISQNLFKDDTIKSILGSTVRAMYITASAFIPSFGLVIFLSYIIIRNKTTLLKIFALAAIIFVFIGIKNNHIKLNRSVSPLRFRFFPPPAFDYVKYNTPKDALFLVPPTFATVRNHSLRSVLIDAIHQRTGDGLIEWKNMMDEILKADFAKISKTENDIQFYANSTDEFERIVNKYNVDYIFAPGSNLKRLTENEIFEIIYDDGEYNIIKVNSP